MEKRLGRGLAQIIETSTQSNPSFVSVSTNQIKPSRYQPRQEFREEALEELKASIRQHGIIEPIIVRPIAHGTYELVAGERRWRAAQSLGIQEVPAIIKALTDQQTIEYSLIENVQREDLNPLEEAKTYEQLMNEFGYTQEQIAQAIGKDRSSISNTLRLLRLPSEIQEAIRKQTISEGHAKVLLSIEVSSKQLEIFKETMEKSLSVRQLELLIADWQPKTRRKRKQLEPQMKAIEDDLRQALGTKVVLMSRKKGGRIIIEYFSQEDLSRILQVLKISA